MEGHYFLSRPRRFGKSLLLSTLRCLCEGRRELFAGLWLGEEGRWRWAKHPVVLVGVNFDPLQRNIAEWKADPAGGG